MSNKRFRVAVISGHPTQWEGPMFGALQASSRLDLCVYYGSDLGRVGAEADSESGLRIVFDLPGMLEGYEYHQVPRGRGSVAWLWREFRRKNFDAVIFEGYSGFPQRVALAAAAPLSVARILRLDSTSLYGEAFWKAQARKLLMPRIFHRFDAFLALSSKTREYLESYHVDSRDIFVSAYRVHNEWYRDQAMDWRKREETVKELGLERFRHIVLAILRFEDRESPLDFVAAAERMGRTNPDTGFVLVGDGSLGTKVRERVKSLQVQNVVLPGYLRLSELPKYYSVAHCFVHPAREECWGLSVNEAMASGVPVVVADTVGCRYDLLPNDEFGLVYPAGDVEAMVRSIRSVIGTDGRGAGIARAAGLRLEGFSYSAAVPEFEAAIEHAVSASRGEAK